MKINQYTVVTGGDIAVLKKNVAALIAEGWMPQGGIAVQQTNDWRDDLSGERFYGETWLYQAMVRGDEQA